MRQTVLTRHWLAWTGIGLAMLALAYALLEALCRYRDGFVFRGYWLEICSLFQK